MATTGTKQADTKLNAARQRWGSVEVLSAPVHAGAVAVAVGRRRRAVPRVAEQRRDISAYRLEREGR